MPDLLDRLWVFAGKMHPMVVHFPIALILVALAIEVLRLRRGKNDPAAAGVLCLSIGAATGVAAAAMGWSLAEGSTPEVWPLGLHRWLGIAAASVAFIGAVLGAVAARKPGPRMLGWYRLVLVCGVGLVALAAHFGGAMVYGNDYVSGAVRSLLGMAPASDSGTAGRVDDTLPEGVNLNAVDFSRDVFPILSANCFKCHAGDTAKSGLRLDTREAILKGGESGKPAMVVGKSADSRLIKFVSGSDPQMIMPPRGSRLTAGQITVLKAWIDQGAPWHKDVSSGDRHWHWAYNPPEMPQPPKVKGTTWVKTPIDRFVLAKLEAKGLKPSGEAERETLIRRASLDIIGLPPTLEEVDAFVKDREPGAYERVIDRLLASPRYGERWARVWLDLARYADSQGYEKDGSRVMWAYRDWVIDAYNRDEPFDRFTIDQIAGDLLPEPTLDQLVATGFHRNTQINEEGGVDPEEFRVEAMIDRANTTSSVWLGSTVGCAQCHDHKYDPFKQKDFYSLLAIFNQDEPDVAIVNSSEVRAAGGMVGVPTREKWAEFDRLAGERKKLVGKPDQAAELAKVDESLKQLTAAQALVMKHTTEPRVSHLFIRGSFRNPGEEVKPGVPTVLGKVPDNADRLTLAKWLIDPKNPLTARVQVNRLWAQLFGKGLVETEEDFGTQGERPTHPELLDWLATEFMKQSWSQKKMLRTIVLSATYRQTSRVTPGLLEVDPANKLLARGPRHRLDAEGIRDNALAAAGMLSPKLFGPSVFPPQPSGVWTQIYSGEQWKESTGEDRFRRGLYTFARRTSPYPTFTGFDAPSREVSCTRRPRTNTPLQALTTLNDPQFFEAAGALAARTLREGGTTPEGRLAYAFRRCVARAPTKGETDRLSKLLTDQLADSRADTAGSAAIVASCPSPRDGLDEPELAAWTLVCNVLLNLDETVTKE